MQLDRVEPASEIPSKRFVKIFNLHRPNPAKQLLERLGLRDVRPSDICPKDQVAALCDTYPDLWGDRIAIGPSDDGDCQSWKNNPGWWRELVFKYSA